MLKHQLVDTLDMTIHRLQHTLLVLCNGRAVPSSRRDDQVTYSMIADLVLTLRSENGIPVGCLTCISNWRFRKLFHSRPMNASVGAAAGTPVIKLKPCAKTTLCIRTTRRAGMSVI